MGDKASDTPGTKTKDFNDLYNQLIPDRSTNETHPPRRAGTTSGDSAVGSTTYQAPSASQENPNAVLNNRGSAYAEPRFAVARDDDETIRKNRISGLESPGAPGSYSQNVAYNWAAITGAFDRNVHPTTPLGINLGLPPSGPVEIRQHVEQAGKVALPDANINASAASSVSGIAGLFAPMTFSGASVPNPGLGSRLSGSVRNVVLIGAISQGMSMVEKPLSQCKPFQIPLLNVPFRPDRAFRREAAESTLEGYILSAAFLPARLKGLAIGAALAVWGVGRMVENFIAPEPGSQPIDALHNAENNLKTDYCQRSAQSMRDTVNSLSSYGLFKYKSAGDPDTTHTESMQDHLKSLAADDAWNAERYDKNPLYTNQLEKLRGGIAVKLAYADVAMQKGTLLPQAEFSNAGGKVTVREPLQYILDPERNKNRPHDYLDFGAEALKSVISAKRDLAECIDYTQRHMGKVCNGKVVDAQEVADLQEMQKDINQRLSKIQCGQYDSNTKTYIGHDIVGAFYELATTDATTSAITPGIAGKNQAMVQSMIDDCRVRKDSDDPGDRLRTSKQYRDLALWQLANLSPSGTATPTESKGPADQDPQVLHYRAAVRDFLYNAEDVCPDTPECPNPDIENIKYVAQVLAGKISANAADQQLQQIANNLDPRVRQQLALSYDGYEYHKKHSHDPGSFHPYTPGDVVRSVVPREDDRQTRVLQTVEEHYDQVAKRQAEDEQNRILREQNALNNQ